MMMTSSFRSIPLHWTLLADAAVSGATGLVMLAGAGALEDLLDLPVNLPRGAGLILLPYVVFLVWLGTRERIPTSGVWSVIVMNALWAAGCIGLLLSGQVEPNAWGIAFVLVQALAVVLFAELQYVGLRASPA